MEIRAQLDTGDSVITWMTSFGQVCYAIVNACLSYKADKFNRRI